MKSPRVLLALCILLAGAFVIGFLGFGAGWRTAQASIASQQVTDIKVIAPAGMLDPGQPGVRLWHDYGAFGLYRINEAVFRQLPGELRERLVTQEALDRILIDAYPFNPLSESLDIPQSLQLGTVQGAALHLVQFVGPIKPEWLDAIQASGARLVHYIPNNAYLVWAEETSRARLSAMVAQGDFLQYSAPYQPYFKLESGLREKVIAMRDSAQVVEVVIQMIRHPGQAASQGVIAGLSLGKSSEWSPVLAFQNARFVLRIGDITTVARLPDVFWIGEYHPPELLDEVQGQILAAHFDASQQGPAGPGYLAWLDSLGFSQDPADYPIVDITDDGIGDGTLDSGDPTLHLLGGIANPSRLGYLINCTTDLDGGSRDGHGHINASIAAGYDVRTGFPYTDTNGFNLGLGINPYGRLAGTRIFGGEFDISSCGGTLNSVIKASYAAGARISSNSWGCSNCPWAYDDIAQLYDVSTRDADPSAPGNQELLFIFSAGNWGPAAQSVVSPGSAKNVVAVGASENYRPGWTDGCIIGTNLANNAMDLAPFSSRGPAPGGRVKPDLIAPGTHIQGTASTNPNYNGGRVCDAYHPDGQTTFAASSGTSHSAPAVAGAASLYYHWLENAYNLAAPSPAMLKAYLVAHPTYLIGAGANDTLPSNNQGFGMPDLEAAFDDAQRFLLDQAVVFDSSGETWTFKGYVVDPAKPVRIVLVYTDQAGALGADPRVNDLNLEAVIGGATYLGNHFEGQWSIPGGSPDSANTVEAIFLPPGTSGSLSLQVTAFNIASDGVPNSGDMTDQDFALVCYNCVSQPDFTLSVEPSLQEVCAPVEASYSVTVGQVRGFTDTVTLSASGSPTNTLARFSPNPVLPPGASALVISNTVAAPAGSYELDITGSAPTSTHATQVGLNLYTDLPGQPDLQAPADGASNQPLRPTFSWSAAGQGSLYDLELAADSGFVDLITQVVGLSANSYALGFDLNINQVYYWRVRSTNACGAGSYSPVSSFLTRPAPGECPSGTLPLEVYGEDFESGAPGWSHDGASDTWKLSGQRISSGNYAFLATDLPNISDQRLISPPILLPAGEDPLALQFWNYQEIESAITGCYDGALLEISSNQGLTWTQLESQLLTDPYDGQVNASFGNPLGGLNSWCGDPQAGLLSLVDLTEFAGQSVQLRFRLGTDSDIGREGWYVDDLAIQSCAPAEYRATLGPPSSRIGFPGSRIIHSFTLQNRGLPDTYNLSLLAGDWPAVLLTSGPFTLDSGQEATLEVRVDVPALVLPMTDPLTGSPKALSAADVFTITVVSKGNPDLVLASTGSTTYQITPGASVSPDQQAIGLLGETVSYTFTLTNTGNFTDTFHLSVSGVWPFEVPDPIVGPIGPGVSTPITLLVTVPLGIEYNASDVSTLTVTSGLDDWVAIQATSTTIAGGVWLYLPFNQRP